MDSNSNDKEWFRIRARRLDRLWAISSHAHKSDLPVITFSFFIFKIVVRLISFCTGTDGARRNRQCLETRNSCYAMV